MTDAELKLVAKMLLTLIPKKAPRRARVEAERAVAHLMWKLDVANGGDQ